MHQYCAGVVVVLDCNNIGIALVLRSYRVGAILPLDWHWYWICATWVLPWYHVRAVVALALLWCCLGAARVLSRVGIVLL